MEASVAEVLVPVNGSAPGFVVSQAVVPGAARPPELRQAFPYQGSVALAGDGVYDVECVVFHLFPIIFPSVLLNGRLVDLCIHLEELCSVVIEPGQFLLQILNLCG